MCERVCERQGRERQGCGGEEYGECVSVCVSVRVERSGSRASGGRRVWAVEKSTASV